MYKFETSTLIECRITDLYRFHLDINNLKKITPSNIDVEILNQPFKPQEGAIANLMITKFLIPQKWGVEISLLKPYKMIVDTAVHSPFKFWRHSHIFTQKGDFCELKDVIEYELPFGFLGRLFNFLILKDIQSMFSFRHSKTKAILEKI